MAEADIADMTRDFAGYFSHAAGDERAGLYLVGSPALGDLSPRQSNLDLVAVTDQPLPAASLAALTKAHKQLRLNGRQAVVCYTTWDALGHPPGESDVSVFAGAQPVEAERLANPMTWAILAHHPVPLVGPAAPKVSSDPEAVRAWCAARLPAIVQATNRLLWRRHLTRVVLQATRCTHGALTGDVVSLRRAGELALPTASHTSHRVITDALGYREGANTSMYWGPFERKSNAATLTAAFLEAVDRQDAATGTPIR